MKVKSMMHEYVGLFILPLLQAMEKQQSEKVIIEFRRILGEMSDLCILYQIVLLCFFGQKVNGATTYFA